MTAKTRPLWFQRLRTERPFASAKRTRNWIG